MGFYFLFYLLYFSFFKSLSCFFCCIVFLEAMLQVWLTDVAGLGDGWDWGAWWEIPKGSIQKYHVFKKSSSFIHYKWSFRFQVRRKMFLELTTFGFSYSSIQKFQVSHWHQRHASATFCDVHSLNMIVTNLKVKFNVGNTIILV